MNIFEAVINNNKDMLIKNINEGNINQQDKENGYTSLHYCAQSGNTEFAKILINKGAKVNIKDNFGNTPLFRAVYLAKDSSEMLKLLIDAGADINSENNYGVSPKKLAASISGFKYLSLFK